MTKSVATKTPNPILDAQSLLSWYDNNARVLPWRVSPRNRQHGRVPDPYTVWLSEIMLQQTGVTTVASYFVRFVTLWPSVHDLAKAPLEDVLVEWAGLGYYARARNLHACASHVVDKLDGQFPDNAKDLMVLPGIGPYTSAAISAICHDEPIAVLDGNVERVMARMLTLKTPVRVSKPEIRNALQAMVPKHRAGDFAQALMDLGAQICAPRAALCERCPLQNGCAATHEADPTAYPVREKKKPRPTRFGHAYVLQRQDGAVWLRKRPDKGLLAQMTEVPGSEWSETGHSPDFPVKGDWTNKGVIRHVFTHFGLEVTVWLLAGADCDLGARERWVQPAQFADQALPSVFAKILVQSDV